MRSTPFSGVPVQPARPRGFSLIELLVAVAIVAILCAIALPHFKLYLAKAKRTQAVAMLDGIYKAQTSYYATAGEYIWPGLASATSLPGFVVHIIYGELGPDSGKFGWHVQAYNFGAANNKTTGYKVWVMTNLDDDPLLDSMFMKVSYSDGNACPSNVAVIEIDDLKDSTNPCASTGGP